MSVTPKVTVLIPVYNCHKYVTEAIDSVLAQSFSNFELLLIDDGSTDGSGDILQSYTDPRICVVRNEKNLGIPKTLNKGLQLARGAYFAVLDNDDYAYPDRLKQQLTFLDRHEEYAAVGTWAVTMDEEGQILSRIKRLLVAPEEVQSQLLFRCCLLHPSMMARTGILRSYGYREDVETCADFDLWVRVARTYKLGILPHVLVRHREHVDRTTRQKMQIVKEEKLAIISAQLVDLGLTFTEVDLERHFLLLRMNGSRFVPDDEYLEWAGAWLLKLRAANQHALRYPPQAFAQVVGAIWLRVCRQASRQLGWTAWRKLWQSPLRAEVCLRVSQQLFSELRERIPVWTRG